MGDFREHGVKLFLDKELYTAFIRLQADKGLGRSFAGLLPFVEGLYHMGYVSREVYENHREKYCQPLLSKKEPTPEELEVREKSNRLNKTLGKVVSQWKEHTSEDWRRKWAQTARQNPGLPNSQRILELATVEIV
jgi:hypothetical protein